MNQVNTLPNCIAFLEEKSLFYWDQWAQGLELRYQLKTGWLAHMSLHQSHSAANELKIKISHFLEISQRYMILKQD